MLGLKFICFIKEIDQKDLASSLKISKQTITDWIKGRSNIKDNYLNELENILGVPKSFIIKNLNKDDMIKLLEIL